MIDIINQTKKKYANNKWRHLNDIICNQITNQKIKCNFFDFKLL